MQKTALTIFSALLISGLAAQAVAAPEHHSKFRRAYNQMTSGSPDAAPTIRYTLDNNGLNVGDRDRSWVGGVDPARNPASN